ncbi:MAG: hypothetical protein ACU85V_14530 [Gammaproteobacteria bacterium]
MIRIATIALIAAVSGTVQANGFAPWNESRVESRSDSQQDEVRIAPYYRSDVATGREGQPAAQADVVIKPFYADDRV